MRGVAGTCNGNETAFDYAAVRVRQNDHPALQAARRASTQLEFFFVCVGSSPTEAGRTISSRQTLQTESSTLSLNAPNGIEYLARSAAKNKKEPGSISFDIHVDMQLPATHFATAKFCFWNGPAIARRGIVNVLRSIKSKYLTSSPVSSSVEETYVKDRQFFERGHCTPTSELATMSSCVLTDCTDNERLGITLGLNMRCDERGM